MTQDFPHDIPYRLKCSRPWRNTNKNASFGVLSLTENILKDAFFVSLPFLIQAGRGANGLGHPMPREIGNAAKDDLHDPRNHHTDIEALHTHMQEGGKDVAGNNARDSANRGGNK